ncbi:MAG: hypothetical protein J5590_09170 [Clostridia bacterium]|nr:hypothetical protein [Clostridia bacterium]
MLLGEILNELDLMLPNPYSADEKTVFLNKTIREIKRFAGKLETYVFDANALNLYPLPEEIAAEDILFVSVNGREMEAENISDEGCDFYYLLPTGFITFEPAPKVGDKIEITCYASKLFKTSDAFESETDFLNQETLVDEEQRFLLLYGAMADIALATEDAEMSNNLRSEFNALKAEAMQGKYKKRGKYPKTKIVM